MSNHELQAKVKELKELKRMAEELEAEITTIEDTIKAAMGEQEEIVAGEYKVTWKPVTSNRFDSAAFKKAHGDLADLFTKTITSRRFCVQ